jgi:hypothetical protein
MRLGDEILRSGIKRILQARTLMNVESLRRGQEAQRIRMVAATMAHNEHGGCPGMLGHPPEELESLFTSRCKLSFLPLSSEAL